jgi:hypothetical protein
MEGIFAQAHEVEKLLLHKGVRRLISCAGCLKL